MSRYETGIPLPTTGTIPFAIRAWTYGVMIRIRLSIPPRPQLTQGSAYQEHVIDFLNQAVGTLTPRQRELTYEQLPADWPEHRTEPSAKPCLCWYTLVHVLPTEDPPGITVVCNAVIASLFRINPHCPHHGTAALTHHTESDD